MLLIKVTSIEEQSEMLNTIESSNSSRLPHESFCALTVRVTDPELKSSFVGTYLGLGELGLSKVPFPLVVQ